jgi:hypothetical protein
MLFSSLQRALIACLVCLGLGACTSLVRVPSDTGRSASQGLDRESNADGRVQNALEQLRDAEQGYARVLAQYVDGRGRVGFAALAADPSDAGLPALERYVRAIGLVPLEQVPAGDARLAHMINAYNALSMYNVIRSGLPPSHAGFAKLRFFVLRKFQIGGQEMSLYSFENDIIRKLNEPRIHFVLNCSALSCPILPRVPFVAESLNQVLDQETQRFFANPENLRVDQQRRTVYFNEILKFYTEDFTPSHAPSLSAYAQRYSTIEIPSDYAIAFTPYDWTVAHRP